jgi:alanine racemase
VSRPIVCEISIAALRHNLQVIYSRLGSPSTPSSPSLIPSIKVSSVVKANAYGHGLLEAMKGLELSEGLALVEFDYALKLRNAGWTKPILLLEGAFDADDVRLARQQNLSMAVHSFEQLEWLEQIQRESPSSTGIQVWLKFNTGMNRLGFSPDEAPRLASQLKDLNSLGISQLGLMTHFANSDVDDLTSHPPPFVAVREQLRRFSLVVHCFRDAGIQCAVSLANSAAVMSKDYRALAATFVDAQISTWVRPGIVLYGATPFEDLADAGATALSLKPAMALKSKILAIQVLAPGSAIGYGSRFVASQSMRIAIVAVGYADGYPRQAPDGTPTWILGKRARLVGRVSMDLIVVDITDIESAQVGTNVELWGANLAVDEVAQHCGTIGYELTCAVAQRVRRVSLETFLD